MKDKFKKQIQVISSHTQSLFGSFIRFRYIEKQHHQINILSTYRSSTKMIFRVIREIYMFLNEVLPCREQFSLACAGSFPFCWGYYQVKRSGLT